MYGRPLRARPSFERRASRFQDGVQEEAPYDLTLTMKPVLSIHERMLSGSESVVLICAYKHQQVRDKDNLIRSFLQ